MRRQGIGLLLVLPLIALVWWLAPPAAAPLYDGLGLPLQAYQYLRGHPPAQPTRLVLTLASGRASPIATVSTPESPPQAHLFLQYNALRVPAGVNRIIVTIRPVSPPAQPKGAHIDGNVYAFSAATTAGTAVPLRSIGARVELRGTGASGRPDVARYVNGTWKALPTASVPANNSFLARATTLGDFALIIQGKATGPPGGGSAVIYGTVGALLLVFAIATILVIRFTRRPGTRQSKG